MHIDHECHDQILDTHDSLLLSSYWRHIGMADQQLVLNSPVSAHLWLNYCNSKDDQSLQTTQSTAIATGTSPIETSSVAAAISTDSSAAAALVEIPTAAATSAMSPAASNSDGDALDSSSIAGAVSRHQLFTALSAAERESALAARESEEV